MRTPEDLEEAIRRLPPQDAVIIWDVYHHQMPLDEVARKMKLSPERAQAIYSRAQKMLRRHLTTRR